MSSTIPKLTMFPTWAAGQKVQGSNTLNANSSFYTAETRFTPAYGVNVPTSARSADTNFYTVGSDFKLRSGSAGDARNYGNSLALDGTILGNLTRAAVPSVTPVIPDLYKDAAKLLSITDARFSDLMAQDSFRLSGVGGMGINVTPGASSNELSLNLDSRSLGFDPSTTNKAYTLPNMTEITSRAIPGAQTIPDFPVTPAKAASKPKPNLNLSLKTELATRPQLPSALNGVNGVFQTGVAKPQNVQFGDNATNPVIQRLLQLQPQEQGLSVAGFNAVDAEQSRQVATVQAGFDVAPGGQFQSNLAGLKNSVIERGMVYPQGVQPRDMDGRMPMGAYFPTAPAQSQDASARMAGTQFFNTASGNIDDPASKKGSGGYLPFQMNSSASGGGTASGGGQSSPFANFRPNTQTQTGSQQQQHQPRRNPVSYFA